MIQLTQSGRGRYRILVVESERCRLVRTAAAQALGLAAYRGTAAEHAALPESTRGLIDLQVADDIRARPELWRESPAAAIVGDTGEHCNLILNQCLDALASRQNNWLHLLNYCALGTGSATPAVTDTVLGSEVVRTNLYLTGSDTTVSDNATRTRTYSKTFDFPAESSSKNYSELGLATAASGATSLMTRALVSGGTVTVGIGQQARVVYSIAVTLAADTVATPSASGWPVSPSTSVQGTSCYRHLDACLTLADTASLYLGTNTSFLAFGNEISVANYVAASSAYFGAYTPGTYKSTRTCTWALGAGNRSDYRCLVGNTSPGKLCWGFLFDQPQTKDNTHTLTITWSITYARA